MFQMANEFSFMRYPILFNGVEKKKKCIMSEKNPGVSILVTKSNARCFIQIRRRIRPISIEK